MHLNFRNTCLKIYEFDPVKFFLAPRLVWEATLNETEVKVDLVIDILLIVEKGIRGRICLYLSICKS